MRKLRLFVLVPLLAPLAISTTGSAQDFDVLIAGGRIVDGSGNPWYRADIAIRDGMIIAIGRLDRQSAKRIILAEGAVVTPGFIDMMGTSSRPLLVDPPSAQSKLRQGITTALIGEGSSHAPQNQHTLSDQWLRSVGLPRWSTFAEYFGLLERHGIPYNVVHNVGAEQIRRVVLGDGDVTPTPAQVDNMKGLVAQAMEDGAVGLSTALIYPPGSYAKTGEIMELAKVAAQYDGVYFTHIRNEGALLLDALREAIRIGQEAGMPVHIYHLKAAGQSNWPLMPKALELIAEARQANTDVTADIYAYTRSGIPLDAFVHPRHYAGGKQSFRRKLGDESLRRQLRREIETTSDWENLFRLVDSDWRNVLIYYDDRDSAVQKKDGWPITGLTLQQLADRRRVPTWTAFFDLVQSGLVLVALPIMNEEQKRMALQQSFVMLSTDAGPVNPGEDPAAHPRAFGGFPRVLAKYVRERKDLSFEEAIRKMTSLAANTLGLRDRGRIAIGQSADLLVFDPAKIRDMATYENPVAYSTGIDYVFVNGVAVIDAGRLTPAMPGKVLRHRRGGN